MISSGRYLEILIALLRLMARLMQGAITCSSTMNLWEILISNCEWGQISLLPRSLIWVKDWLNILELPFSISKLFTQFDNLLILLKHFIKMLIFQGFHLVFEFVRLFLEFYVPLLFIVKLLSDFNHLIIIKFNIAFLL